MKNRLLVVGGVAVALLLVGLLWVVRSSANGPASGPASPAPASPDLAPPSPVAPVAPPPAAQAPSAQPEQAATPPPAAAERRDSAGNIVHDHSGEPPPPGSPLTPDTVFAVRQALVPLVKACTSGSADGTITVVARLSVAGGKLSAEPLGVSHQKFKDEAYDACVSKAVAGLAMAAPAGQIDTSYKLAMAFTP